MKKYLTIAVVLLAVSFVKCTKDKDMAELRKHNELETKDQKLDEIMNKIDQHCEAVAINSTEDSVGSRHRRQSALDKFNQLRGFIGDELSCPDDSQDPNPTESPSSIEGPCTSMLTVNLTGSWRKDDNGSNLLPASGFYACDRELQQGRQWFRFTGDAGVQLADTCRPAFSCGAHGGFWSNATMPTTVGQIRRVPIYGSWNGDCTWYLWPQAAAMMVQRCSATPGDFIYSVQGSGSCYWTFCGMDISPPA